MQLKKLDLVVITLKVKFNKKGRYHNYDTGLFYYCNL